MANLYATDLPNEILEKDPFAGLFLLSELLLNMP